ncbi:hypothetical protein [Synechococcus sp. C9]|jgi:hypothetical protein|uniref:hypothetical protein n=1 Tax=Synechococcus sp. C9 TaxID=102119 RepID=UPI001FF569FD|nr:hypothetical protein [Synechococcus sp. C9]
MSAEILAVTLILGSVPLVCVMAAFFVPRGGIALLIALWFLVICGVIWCVWRPTAFVIRDDNRLELRFPVRRRWRELHPQRQVRQLSLTEFHQEAGWVVRVGASGFGGGFGWLWTQRRGWVEVYISRGDGLVLLEQPGSRPLLVSPAQPEQFVELLTQK